MSISTSSNRGSNSIWQEQLLFFLAGLGSSIGYISTLSSLVYFKLLFGPNSFVYLNCAIFLPLLPVSLAQGSHFDILYTTRVTFLVRGIAGYGFVLAGTLGMVAFGKQKQHGQHGEYEYEYEYEYDDDEQHYGLRWVIYHALLQGIGGAVLFGQLNQLASFDRLAKTSQATVSAGVQASALVVLAASVGSGFGGTTTMTMTMTNHGGDRFASFATWVLGVEGVCFAASLWLLAGRPRIQYSMLRRDASMRQEEPEAEFDHEEDEEEDRRSSSSSSSLSSMELEDFHELLSTPVSSTNRDGILLRQPFLSRMLWQQSPSSPERVRTTSSFSESHSFDQSSAELSLTKLLYHSRWCCYGMALTLVPSFLVGSWFTRVQTNWMELAQVLFYTRIGSDLLGRLATMLVPPSSIRCVVWVAGLRWTLVALFFRNASRKLEPIIDLFPERAVIRSVRATTTTTAATTAATTNRSTSQEQRDALSIALVAMIAFLSGYLVTSCYQLAPQQLPGTPELRATNAAKQASLLTVAFSVSAIGGLASSFVLLAIGV
eukprot:jgi/Psemu1/285044/fgenesh1_pg.72_\